MPAISLDEQIDRMPVNTRWYAEYWINTGEQHPQEHWYLSEILAPFRKAWNAL